ncbi:MAG: GGDEF domain-containing protein [Deltaproteobacteria bacterium]|nr:GGDEF domain-containing protein [Deltaproteobacteria bacterium]
MVIRSLFTLIVPGGLVFFATVILLQFSSLKQSVSSLVHIYPSLVAAAGILLGWRFNRSRLVFAILILALADRTLLIFSSGSSGSAGVGLALYNAIAFLLPLNLTALSFTQERGIANVRGLARLGIIFFQVVLVYVICFFPQLGVAGYLNYQPGNSNGLSRLPLALPAMLAFGVAFFLLAMRFIKRETVLENGFFWALLSVFFALAIGKIGNDSTIYFATAGLVLVVSVIETSHSMAFRDELTGIPGRRALDEALLKLTGNYSVAMLDIDFFKKFNDRYGHDVGDQVLRLVASRFAQVSGGGKPYRYGGEEFTVVFPGKTVSETMPHLEKLRKEVAKTRFIVRAGDRRRKKPENPRRVGGPRKRVKITMSIGVAERNQRYGSPPQVIQAADKALYRAKKKGRNRVST